jgi:hypothetical protein
MQFTADQGLADIAQNVLPHTSLPSFIELNATHASATFAAAATPVTRYIRYPT